MKTIQEIFRELADAFETGTRDSGEDFVKLRDDAPEWIADSDLIHAAHDAIDGRLPDDWVYEALQSLADSLSNYDEPDEDAAHEAADGLVDIYTSDLLRWVSDRRNADLADEAVSELGAPADDTIEGRARLGQYYALERLIHSLLCSVRERLNELEDEDDGGGE